MWYTFFTLLLALHPIHVSVCDISATNSGKVELSFKIFYDDLQSAMGLTPGGELPKKYKGADQLIETFINKNFAFYINGKKTTLKYEGSFSNPPAIWTEMTVIGVKADEIKTIEIDNRIMTSLFDDQTNLVNLHILDKKESTALKGNKLSWRLAF
jgi:hypothetical protein